MLASSESESTITSASFAVRSTFRLLSRVRRVRDDFVFEDVFLSAGMSSCVARNSESLVMYKELYGNPLGVEEGVCVSARWSWLWMKGANELAKRS